MIRWVWVSGNRLLPLLLGAGTRLSFAQTNGVSGDPIPPLLPPRGEMPPTLWEQYGVLLVVGGFFTLVLLSGAIWLITRRKPGKVIPAVVEARATLEALRQTPEDGALLMRVSQVLRRYVAASFTMPKEELTTSEFCEALAAAEQVKPDLCSEVARFLKECDVRKFAPASASATVRDFGAVPQALKLIAQVEAHLEHIRQTAAVRPPVFAEGKLSEKK